VGLNIDLNTNRYGSGQIYYQKLDTNTSFFQRASDTIKLLNSTIVPINIFMVTFDAVLPYNIGINSTYNATLQIFLLADSSNSYVIFNFTSCLSGLSLNSPSGLNYNFTSSWTNVAITNQCSASNVNREGVWVFEALGIFSKNIFGYLFL